MAHVAETRTTFDDMLKYGYEDIIVQSTKEQSALMSKIETITPTKHFGGKSITFAVLYNSQGSVGSKAEGDNLPVNLPGNFDNAVVPIYYHYFGISVTGQTILTSQNRLDAFAEAWTLETQIKTRAFRQHINRQLCADGNAILAQQDGAVAGQVITVDNASGWSGFRSSPVNGARHLTANQYIQVRDSSGTVEDAGLKITSVSTVGSLPSMSIDGSSNPEWNSIVKRGSTAGTAEAITALRLMEAIAEVQMVGGGKIDYIFTSPGVALALGQLADENNQIINAKQVELGYPSFAIMGVPVFQDPYLPDEIFLVDARALGMYQPAAPGWWDPKGTGQFISQVKGASAAKDQLEAYWFWYMTLGIKNRKWCGKIEDITVNANFKI